jgi:hypothetical protein
MSFTKQIAIKDLAKIACGLNIEGYRPSNSLPKGCEWINIVQVIDEPLIGETFDDVMAIVKSKKYKYIEEAVNIDISTLLKQLTSLINNVKKVRNNILVHVHQYEGTTILHETLSRLTCVKTICDKTNFYENPINYKKDYPDIDCLISISQCAGFGHKAGTWIIPGSFMHFNTKENDICLYKIIGNNNAKKYVDFDHVTGNILVVDDLWNPSFDDIANKKITLTTVD